MSGVAPAGEPPLEAAFLAALADPARPRVAADRVLLVVAHPDDEVIGVGAALPRLDGLHVLHVTDGAPRDGADARRRGHPTPEAYAAVRAAELDAALTLAGVPRTHRHALLWPDQGVAARMGELAALIGGMLDRLGTAVVLTHAYEGGHPDHDATALAVGAAVRTRGVAVVTMPYYRLGPGDEVLAQSPTPGPGAPAVAIVLSPAERAFKARLYAAHASQAATLAAIPIGRECFRLAPDDDPLVPPNGGRLLYERWGLGMTGGRFAELARAAFGGPASC